jgi:hypothetical protein
MGAEFITLNYDGKLSGSEVEKKVVEHIRNYDPREDFDPCDYDDDEDGYDDCDQGYTGTWAEVAASCDIKYDIFKNESEAEKWLADNCEKWEGAKACRYYTNEVSPKIKALLEKDQKLKSFEEKYKVLKAKLAELVKTKPRAGRCSNETGCS